ncbi:MAG: hypothetical protein SGI98_00410, partial [Verrucomicrobiota bacterium]|nr:hypothetical protein [Verrucomicrobiota bacterium]
MNEDAVVQMIAIGSAGIYKFSSMVNCGGADVTTNAMTSFQWVGGGTASTKHIVTTSAGKQKETVDVKHIYTVGTQTYTNTGTGSNEVYVIAMASVSGPQVVVVGQENTYTGYSTGGVSQSDFPSGWPRWENNGSAASSGVMSFETAGSQTVRGICGTSTQSLTVVALGVDSVSPESNAVAVGESVTVVATPDPVGQAFPSGYPTWNMGGSAGATSTVTISTVGTNTVSATCGT